MLTNCYIIDFLLRLNADKLWCIFSDPGICYDESEYCPEFAREGKCINSALHKYANFCKKSCGLCGKKNIYIIWNLLLTYLFPDRWRVVIEQISRHIVPTTTSFCLPLLHFVPTTNTSNCTFHYIMLYLCHYFIVYLYNTIQYNCLLYRAQSTGTPYSRAQRATTRYHHSATTTRNIPLLYIAHTPTSYCTILSYCQTTCPTRKVIAHMQIFHYLK